MTSIEKDLDQVKEKEKEVEADLEEAERELDVAHKNEEELEEQLEDVKNKVRDLQEFVWTFEHNPSLSSISSIFPVILNRNSPFSRLMRSRQH